MTKITSDAIIIGAGVIGTAIAFELAKAGYKTLNIDRNLNVGHGSTSASCAIIRMHYSTLDGTALAFEGYHYWRDWRDYLEAAAGDALAQFREVGCLVMQTDENDFLAKHMETSRKLGCPFEELDAIAIKARLPIYDLARYAPAKTLDDDGFARPTGGTLSGGVLWPTAGYVTDPAFSAQNLADAAARHGASFLMGQQVADIMNTNGRVSGVSLIGGKEIHAPVVINVAGPASAKINKMAGVDGDMNIKTRALRQEVVHLPSPPDFDFENNGLIVSDGDIGCYCRPEHGNNILVGSEDPACDAHIWVDDDENFNREFTDQWQLQAMRYGQRVPSLGIPGRAKGVVDLYDASDDWIPIYDKSSLPGYYMACGTSGNQYKNAPVAGKLMAALIDYCENGGTQDETPLQFHLENINHTINTGFYSRKREINRESSFSVLG